MIDELHATHTVGVAQAGARLDRFCAAVHPEQSRSRLTSLIKAGRVLVDGRPARPSEPLRAGCVVTLAIPPPRDERVVPEEIPLYLLYEDEAVIVIDKPADLVVHPGAGVQTGTLVAALLHHDPQIAGVGGEGRAGLVHRLDRGTTGVMVIARTELAHRALVEQFQARRVEKRYHAIVWGRPRQGEGSIELTVGRDPRQRTKMSTRAPRGRAAHSEYSVLQDLPGFALLAVQIHTGRTHQVRVHLSAIGHPLVGDKTYGGDRGGSLTDVARRTAVARFMRPALHAARLAFEHPTRGERLLFEAPWPADLTALWSALGGQPL